MYDALAVEEMFLRTLKIPPTEVLNPAPGSEDRDPVSENVAAAMGQPIYVLPQQDHLAHLQVHLAFLKSPMFGSNPVIMSNFFYPMAMHMRDHLLNYYLVEAHNAVDEAQTEQLIAEEAEEQVEIILKVQEFIENQLGGFAQELAQITETAQQFKPENQPQQPGDAMKIAELSAQIKQSELQQRTERDGARIQLDNAKMQASNEIAQLKMQQTAEIERAKLAASQQDREERSEIAGLRELSATERNNISEMSETDRLNTREQGENKRKAEDLAARERMNSSDNMTAKELAAMEMESGQKTSYTSGGGIDP